MRSAIMASDVVIPATSEAGAVSRLLGVHLPGPLDCAGITVPLDDDGVPGDPDARALVASRNIARPHRGVGERKGLGNSRPRGDEGRPAGAPVVIHLLRYAAHDLT